MQDFPELSTLRSEERSLSDFPLLPSKLLAMNDKAIVFDNGETGLFKVYSLPDFGFLYSFGEIGEGPDQLKFVDQNSLQVHNQAIVVFTGEEIVKYTLDLTYAEEIQRTKLPMLGSLLPINRLVLLTDSLFISDIWEVRPGGAEHQISDVKGQASVVHFGKLPQDASTNRLEQSELYRRYLKSLVVNRESGKMVSFYIHENLIRYYSKEGYLVREVEVDFFNGRDIDRNDFTFRVEPVATKDFIYVMYIGRSKQEIIDEPMDFRPQIEIWDWDGNLIRRYLLDQPITTFAVSDDYKKLYGISFFKEDVLFEYDLNPLDVASSIVGNHGEDLLQSTTQKPRGEIRKSGSTQKVVAENDFYSMELPIGWNYATNMFKERNLISEQNGVYTNYGGYVMENHLVESKVENGACGASMQIWVSSPVTLNFDIPSYLRSRVEGFRSNNDLLDLTVREFSDSLGEGYIIRYRSRSVDPKGNTQHHIWERAIYEKDGAIIQTSFGSCELFDRYYEEVRESFATLRLKKKVQ